MDCAFRVTCMQFVLHLCGWLRPCATSRKVVGSIPDEIIDCFSIYLFLQPHYGPRVHSASFRNDYQKNLSRDKAGPARKTENPTAI
jgi:hypothetical protein